MNHNPELSPELPSVVEAEASLPKEEPAPEKQIPQEEEKASSEIALSEKEKEELEEEPAPEKQIPQEEEKASSEIALSEKEKEELGGLELEKEELKATKLSEKEKLGILQGVFEENQEKLNEEERQALEKVIAFQEEKIKGEELEEKLEEETNQIIEKALTEEDLKELQELEKTNPNLAQFYQELVKSLMEDNPGLVIQIIQLDKPEVQKITEGKEESVLKLFIKLIKKIAQGILKLAKEISKPSEK